MTNLFLYIFFTAKSFHLTSCESHANIYCLINKITLKKNDKMETVVNCAHTLAVIWNLFTPAVNCQLFCYVR